MVRLESKAAGETRNYTFDWTSFLGSDSIASSSVTATGLTVSGTTFDTNSVDVIVQGGTDGTVARITNTITTAGGLIESETFTLPITLGEPVSLAEAKMQCRVLDDSEDALIASYIRAAREYVENYTGRILLRRTITEQRDRFGNYLELNWRPIVSVNSVGYPDSAGNAASYSDYLLSTNRNRVYPSGSFPSLGLNGEVTVQYTAGYAEGEAPQSLLQAILVYLVSLKERRGMTDDEWRSFEALCNQHRSVLV